MKKIFSALSFSLILFTLSTVSFGQAARPAVDQTFSDPAAGFRFTAPAGWKNNKGAAGFAFVNPAQTIIIAVRPHGYNDFVSVIRDTQLDPGFQFSGRPQDLKAGGKAVRITKQTQDGLGVIDVFVSFSPNGGGVVVMALSDGANSDAAWNVGLKVSDSVVFTKPQQAAVSSSPWRAALAGKHLLYLYSGNGYFEEKHIHLCTSGTFYQTTGSGGFTPNDVDGGSFAARGGKTGRWSAEGDTLLLRFQDGSVGEYNLTKRAASNEIGMNGRRYFVQSNANCN